MVPTPSAEDLAAADNGMLGEEAAAEEAAADAAAVATTTPAKRKAGRPAGSRKRRSPKLGRAVESKASSCQKEGRNARVYDGDSCCRAAKRSSDDRTA
mmetsp:Transcript_17036/g.48935  ORF Transcript_17036/g.48935 Transcript_17036/m.48935 type:complete len:98 (+) Transcript_17036:344-637(+)